MPNSSRSISDQPHPELSHDGTVTGCLCAIAEACRRPANVSVSFSRPGDAMSLFAAVTDVPSDPARAERFLEYLAERSSPETVHVILRALTAMPEGVEMPLLGYVRKALVRGACIAQAHADPDVAFIHRHARKVSLEIHRFKGLLRFQELRSGRFLALYEPDYDITLPLAFHFRRRLASHPWVILDCRRRLAATWNGTRLNAETPDADLLSGELAERCLQGEVLSDAEERSQRLWKVFHRTVAIETRANTGLQRQFMPARYWKHLPEMSEGSPRQRPGKTPPD